MRHCLSLAVAAALLGLAARAEGGPRRAPLNPEFVQWLEREKTADRGAMGAGRWPGLAPSPVDLDACTSRPEPAARRRAVFPPAYDLRALGRVTPVRNQGQYGTCWAHATLAAIESRLMPGTPLSLSVNHLANRHGFDYGYNDGGGNFMAIAYLARWEGPVDESDDPYPHPGASPAGLAPRLHVQKAMIVGRSGPLDLDGYKAAIMAYGAVYVGMFWTDSACNWDNGAYYYTGTNGNNHAVALAGWDDLYPADRFLVPPPGPGALIFKNSFGANCADAGYFYASYYDEHFAPGGCTVYDLLESPTNYSGIYQHDPLGWVSSYTYGDQTYAVNVFAATAACPITAVGFYAPDPVTAYHLRVYRNVPAGAPTSAVMALVQAGLVTNVGFHTVALSRPVPLAAGERFAVGLVFPQTDTAYPMALEYAYTGYSSRATSAPGQSYGSGDGVTWDDLTRWWPTANNCIKAFAGRRPAAAPEDFDGDRCRDLAVYGEGSGLWYGRPLADESAAWVQAWGGPGLMPVSGDYDGDGRADLAAYAPASGLWFIRSLTGGVLAWGVPWGVPGMVPVPGDYDADGRADLAVYDSASGLWFITTLAGDALAWGVPWGGPGLDPVPGDFNNDGQADLAVYMAATGGWYVRSPEGIPLVLGETWGGPGLLPVSGDFDGDGGSDLALYEAAMGGWYIRTLAGGALAWALPWGGPGLAPVSGDFDGDGRTDLALYDAASGGWYIRTLAGQVLAWGLPWGGPGFEPVGP